MRLYEALVRSRLEYCSSAWNPIYMKYNDVIERVQKKYTRMFFFKFGMQKAEYKDRLNHLKMRSLNSRRKVTDEIVLYKILHKHMDTKLIDSISFYTHGRQTRRNKSIFYTPTYTSNIVQNEPLHRMQDHHDKYFPGCDIFSETLHNFKASVLGTDLTWLHGWMIDNLLRWRNALTEWYDNVIWFLICYIVRIDMLLGRKACLLIVKLNK